MITRTHLIDVLFVIVPHSLLLDIAGPAEAFRLANQHRERRGQPPRFRLCFASHDATLSTSVGLSLAGLVPLPQRLSAPTWVVVVGQPTAHTRATPAIVATAKWLNETCASRCLPKHATPGHHLLGALLAAGRRETPLYRTRPRVAKTLAPRTG
jgi:transcriptional regulator GlxA family with amidase domain